MVDLSLELAGVKLKNPLVCGAGPNTKNFPTAVSCIKAGFGAIVVRSLHQQHLNELTPPFREFWHIYGGGRDFTKSLYSFQSTGAPARRVNTGVAPGFGGAVPLPEREEWAEEVHKITRVAQNYGCAVIASIGWCGSNLSDEELWKVEARLMTEIGVDALQLHTAPSPATEPGRYMTIAPQKYLGMPIKAAKAVSHLPVFVKLPVDCCDTITMASIAQKAGADGVVPVTRWVSLPVDINHEREPVWRAPGIGGPWSAPIMNGLVFRMRHAPQPIGYLFGESADQFPEAVPVTVPIVPSGGVRSGADVIGYIVAGANAAEVCAQIIIEGPGVAGRIVREINDWMAGKGYTKIADFQGILRLLEPARAKDIPQWLPVVDENLCNACMDCIRGCSNQAISLVEQVAHVKETRCEGCRNCYNICPTYAISLKD